MTSDIAEASLPASAVSEKTENSVAPSTAGMTTKVVKGSLWTLAGQVAPMAVSFFATPFVIRFLGSERYGVLILIGLIPTYFSFADFGMSVGSTKFGAAAYVEGDQDKEVQTVHSAAIIVLLASLPIALGLFLCSFRIAQLFNIPPDLVSEASFVLKLASITFVINLLNNIFNTPQLIRLRMNLNTLINSGFRILAIIATPIVIFLGGGIMGALLILMISSILTLFGHLYISGRLLPGLFGITANFKIVRQLLKFGVAMVGASIAAMLVANLEKGILPKIVSVEALAHYSVAFTFATMLTMFSGAMVPSLLPAFAQLQAKDKREQLNTLYSRGIRINVLWLLPALVFLSLVAKPFFTLWAGEDFGRESVIPFYILSAGLLFNVPAYLPYTAIMASGRADIFTRIYWAELIPYVFLVWILTQRFGITGTAAAWSIRMVVDAIIQFFVANRLVGISYVQGGLFWFAIGALVLVVPFTANLYFGENYLATIPIALIAAFVYTFIVWKFILGRDELSWISNRFTTYLGR